MSWLLKPLGLALVSAAVLFGVYWYGHDAGWVANEDSHSADIAKFNNFATKLDVLTAENARLKALNSTAAVAATTVAAALTGTKTPSDEIARDINNAFLGK